MKKKRSIGVTIFGWYFIVSSSLGSLRFLNLLLNQNYFKLINSYTTLSPDKYKLYLLSMLVLQILTIIIGINILALKEIWRKTTLFLTSFLFIYGVLFILLGQKNNNSTLLGMQILFLSIKTIIILFFFTRPKVKSQFEQTETENIKNT